MNDSGHEVSGSAAPRNAGREARILDAAADLIAHYGYDKTTVSDIARDAGISKGAIYLHFNTKDALFESLLKREMRRYARQWIERLEADPKGGTLGGMYRAMLGALDRNPFMAAMLRRDARVFGNYLRKPDNFVRARRHPSTRQELVAKLQEAGAIRRDVDPRIVAHIMNMLAYGLVAMDQIMDASEIPPTAEIVEGIATIFDRALTPEDGGDSEVGKAIVRRLVEARAKAADSSASGRAATSETGNKP